MEFLECSCFKRDIKLLQKKCREKNLEEEVKLFLSWLVKEIPDFEKTHTVLYHSSKFTLFKTRLKGCGKGKRGGFRLIWAVNKEKTKILLIRLYSKSEIENIPTHQLVEQLLECIQ